jgi:alpha-L-fucosidase
MRYLVITSKHYDGFAMFGSKVSPYNLVDATPFKRDVCEAVGAARAFVAALVETCDQHGWRIHAADPIGDLPLAQRKHAGL